jgi:hypothetical protein
LKIVILILFPLLDVFSDFLYILTSDFFLDIIFILCVFFYLLPCAFFAYEIIHVEKLNPRPPLCIRFPIDGNVWWLTSRGSVPLINGSHPAYLPEDIDSFFKIIFLFLVWIYYSILQLVTWLAFLLWTLVLDPPMILWTVLGIFLYQTKVLALTPVWNMWVERWAGDGNHEKYLKKGMLDVKVLNKSLFHEFVFETTPQIIVQFVNGELMQQFTFNTFQGRIGYFSISMSILFALDGLYSFGYYIYYKKTSLDKVPLFIDIPPELLAEYLHARNDKDHKQVDEYTNSAPKTPSDAINMEIGNVIHAIEMKSVSKAEEGIKLRNDDNALLELTRKISSLSSELESTRAKMLEKDSGMLFS